MGRVAPTHKVMKLSEMGLIQGCGWDDELTFNTQVGVHLACYASAQTDRLD